MEIVALYTGIAATLRIFVDLVIAILEHVILMKAAFHLMDHAVHCLQATRLVPVANLVLVVVPRVIVGMPTTFVRGLIVTREVVTLDAFFNFWCNNRE